MENQKCDIYKITSIKQISESLFQISVNSVSTFYLRKNYLHNQNIILDVDIELSVDEFEDCVNAGLAFSAEKKAMDYLGKTEYSRFLLRNKLQKKEHSISSINQALDYLEERGYLNDRNFSSSYISSQTQVHIYWCCCCYCCC